MEGVGGVKKVIVVRVIIMRVIACLIHSHRNVVYNISLSTLKENRVSALARVVGRCVARKLEIASFKV